MGKLVFYVTLLIFIDLLFIITGQICISGTCSLGSILFNSILELINGNFSVIGFFTNIIGNIASFATSGTGIASLIVGAAVTVGGVLISRDSELKYIPVAITLSLLAADFVIISSYLFSINVVLGMLLMAPIIITFIFTILEWLRGKD